MKIVVNTGNYEFLNSIIKEAKIHNHEVKIARLEKTLFEKIDLDEIDAFVLTSGTNYVQAAINEIKKKNKYTPVIVIEKEKYENFTKADFLLQYDKNTNVDIFASILIYNISKYIENFGILHRLTTSIKENIIFGDCVYNPVKRILYHKGEFVGKFSPKQSGIFEILASNFGEPIKKDIILEKVWQESNYFVGRSHDVFVSHIRKALSKANVNMTITNTIDGLVLDYNSSKKQ